MMFSFLNRISKHYAYQVCCYGLTISILGSLLAGCEVDSSPQAAPLSIYPAPATTRAKARHLLITYEGAWRANTRRTKQNARIQAAQYHQQIQSGVDFAYLAAQYSEDPQKKDGGLLGIVEKGRMVKEFEDVLFALDINAISGVVETGFGFHIIQRLPLEEVQLIHIEVDSVESKNIVFQRLQQGVDPRALAQEYSVGPHGLRGGELGWFERTDLDTLFVESVFALTIGTCSTAIARDEHWHFFCRQG